MHIFKTFKQLARQVVILSAVGTLTIATFASGPAYAQTMPTPDTRRDEIRSYIGGTAWYDPNAGICPAPAGAGSIDAGEAEARNAKIVIGIAKTLRLGQQGALIGLMTAVTESNLKNYANGGNFFDEATGTFRYQNTPLAEISQSLPHDAVGNDYDSVGIMQQRPSTGWSTYGNGYTRDIIGQLMNPAYAAQAFFGVPNSVPLPESLAQPSALRKGLVNLPGDWKTMDPGAAAQAVQGSAFPDRYNENRSRAESLLSQYWDSSPSLTLPIQPSSTTVGADPVENFCLGTGGHDAILQKIKEYAWADYRAGYMGKKPAYQEAVNRASYKGGCDGVDCGAFVTIVMRESGADPQYNTDPECNTTCQLAYLRRSSSGAGAKYTRVTDKAALQPGDIAIRDDGDFGGLSGHTFFFVGTAITEDAEGNPWTGGQAASSSFCERAPMASGTDTFELYEWYHLN